MEVDGRALSDEALETAIRGLAASIDAALRRLLTLIVELDDRGLWADEGHRYAIERDALVKLRDGMAKFVRLYEYIAQVVPLADPELEKLARFVRLYRKRLADVPVSEIDLGGLQMTHWRLFRGQEVDMSLGVAEPPPPLDPARGSVAPGRDRTRERISEIIRALNDLFGDDPSESDRLKQVSKLAAIGEFVGRDATVGKQLAARNGEEQMMQGGDLQRTVTSAVIDLLVDNRDEQTADALLKDGDKMASYARLVFRLLAAESHGTICHG